MLGSCLCLPLQTLRKDETSKLQVYAPVSNMDILAYRYTVASSSWISWDKTKPEDTRRKLLNNLHQHIVVELEHSETSRALEGQLLEGLVS